MLRLSSATPETWEEQLQYYMTSPTSAALNLTKSLYGSNLTAGSTLFNKDAIYACHAYFTAAAFRNASVTSAFRYSMSIPPATHGQDQFYYFFVSHESANALVEEPDVARAMQRYIRNFIFERNMSGGGCDGGMHWPAYGREGRWMNITMGGFEVVYGEDHQKARCEALLAMIDDPANGF